MKIIVRSPNWIGDCVMSIGAIRSLKYENPDSEIFLLTRPKLKSVYSKLEEISNFIELPKDMSLKNMRSLIKKIKDLRINKGILFTNSFSSALIFKLAGVSDLTGYKKDLRGFMLSKKLDFQKRIIHQSQFYQELINLFNGFRSEKRFPNTIELNDSDKKKIEDLIRKVGIDAKKKIIGVSPYTAYGPAKEWPAKSFAEVINKIREESDVEIILFGSPGEKKRLDDLASMINGKVFLVAEGYSLFDVFLIIKTLGLFIGNDSGLMHVASALHTPLIGIYGSTLPEKSFPYSKDSEFLYKQVYCSPCLNRNCPTNHECMDGIDSNEVLKIARKYPK